MNSLGVKLLLPNLHHTNATKSIVLSLEMQSHSWKKYWVTKSVSTEWWHLSCKWNKGTYLLLTQKKLTNKLETTKTKKYSAVAEVKSKIDTLSLVMLTLTVPTEDGSIQSVPMTFAITHKSRSTKLARGTVKTAKSACSTKKSTSSKIKMRFSTCNNK